MRLFVHLSLLTVLLSGCPSAGEEAGKEDEIEALKKRVTRLETRLRQIETRMGKPGGKPGAKPGAPPRGKVPGKDPGEAPVGPTRFVQVAGDAKAVMLTGAERRFRLPGQVPAGQYKVLVAFGEDPMAPKGTVVIPEGEAPLTLTCTAETSACAL